MVVGTLSRQCLVISDTIQDVAEYMHQRLGIPPRDQRIALDGERQYPTDTLDQCGIQHNDTLDMMVGQTGMISSFTSSDKNDPLIHYLMLTDESRSTAIVPLAELRAKAKTCNSNPYLTFNLDRTPVILNLLQCNWLNAFLDYMWIVTQREGENRVDMKLAVPGTPGGSHHPSNSGRQCSYT